MSDDNDRGVRMDRVVRANVAAIKKLDATMQAAVDRKRAKEYRLQLLRAGVILPNELGRHL